MTELKTWTDRVVKRPVGGVVAVVLCLQVAYLTFLAHSQYVAQLRLIDRVVEAASLGMQQENRPVIETALLAGLNGADVRQVALCRGNTPSLAYPIGSNPCLSGGAPLLQWRVVRSAIGAEDTSIVFVMDGARTFGAVLFLLAIAGALGLAVAVILSRARRRFWTDVLDPLRLGLSGKSALDIRELEELRQRVREAQELKNREAVSQALFNLSTQLAHDIRSPLAVLEAMSEKMALAFDEDSAAVRDAVGRMRGIADSLLSRYSSTRSAGASQRPTVSVLAQIRVLPTDLAPLVESIVKEKRLQYRDRRGLRLEWESRDTSNATIAEVEPEEFKRVVSNLLNNAIEALRGGKGHVRVGLISNDDQIEFFVHDDGRGIAPDVLATLGGRGKTHGKTGGIGLGLAHAKSCAKRWGGRLDLESALGRGTTVKLSLPRSPMTPAPELFDAVLIDDDELVRKLWQGSARDNGKKLVAFADADDFLARHSLIDTRSPVYIDHELAGGQRGELVAQRFHDLGFRRIYLATGLSSAAFETLPWITAVVGKGAPWNARPDPSVCAL